MSNIESATNETHTPSICAGLNALGKSRWFLDKMLEGLDEKQMMVRAGDGGNHPMWNAGHIATTEDMFLCELTGKESGLPEGWMELFAYGTAPSDDASIYPGVQEVRRVLDERRSALVGWWTSIDDSDLRNPVGEQLRTLTPSFGDVAAGLAFHEGVHSGQISASRRSCGLGPLF